MEQNVRTRNISRLRTFNDDLVRAQTLDATSSPRKRSHIPPKRTVPQAKDESIADVTSHTVASDELQQMPVRTETKTPVVSHIPPKIAALPKDVSPRIEHLKQEETSLQSEEPTILNKKYEELSDEVAAVSQRPTKASILSDDASIYDTELGGGTIIRDTKRKRFRLIPATIEAFKQWIAAQQDDYAKRHEPLKVAKAESRKETIEEAVEQAQTAPAEDFATVVKRLKQVPRTQISSTLTFKKKADLPKPQWTHITSEAKEPVSQEVTPPVVESVAEKKEPGADVSAQIDTSATAEDTAPDPEPVSTPVPQPQEEPEPQEWQSEEPSAAEEEASAWHNTEDAAPVVANPAEQTEIGNTALPDMPVPPPVKASVPQYQNEAARNVPRFPYALLAGVVLLMTALGMGTSYFFFVMQDTEGTAEQPQRTLTRPPELITADFEEAVLIESKEQLLGELAARAKDRTQVTQIYPTIKEDEEEVPAGALTIMSVLGTRTQESFNRNIEEMTFGATGNGDAFVLIEIANFDIAFSGMLNWEKTLSADLQPLFGEVVRETYDPTSRTNTQLTPAYFKDAIASNAIVRVLLDEHGDDRITYTFVDRDTILMTTTRAVLEGLLPRVR